MKTRVTLVAAAITLLWCVTSPAQEPIPTGERGSLSIEGTVRDEAHEPIAGATVKAILRDGQIMRSAVTDPSGRFVLRGLPPGTYRIGASVPGFQTIVIPDHVLTPGSSEKLDIVFGGPIPPGEQTTPTLPGTPQPPAQPSPGSTEVPVPPQTSTLILSPSDDLELLHWLNEQASARKNLVVIVPADIGTSVAVLSPSDKDERPVYTVIPVSEKLEPKRLKSRLDAQPTKTFLGIHQISGDLYLIVFRDGS